MTRPDRPDPLQPAERALADALAGATPPSGPSPGLDAAILAAARAAAAEHAGGGSRSGSGSAAAATPPSTPTSGGYRRRRRNPAWLRGGALAATLVLAVGVAWQMRPQLEVVQLPTEAPAGAGTPASAADVSPAPASARRLHAPAEAAPAAVEAAPHPPALAAEAAEAAAPAAAPELPGANTPASATTDPAASDVVLFDAPHREPSAARDAAIETTGRELSGTAAKSAAPAPRNAAASRPQPITAPAPAPPPPPPAPPAPPAPRIQQALPPPVTADESARRTRTLDSLDGRHASDGDARHDEDWLDQPLDDTPPASVESPAVREAWLARIRELVASERYVEARESFAEFRRRHPGAAVPDDLRTLLGEE